MYNDYNDVSTVVCNDILNLHGDSTVVSNDILNLNSHSDSTIVCNDFLNLNSHRDMSSSICCDQNGNTTVLSEIQELPLKRADNIHTGHNSGQNSAKFQAYTHKQPENANNLDNCDYQTTGALASIMCNSSDNQTCSDNPDSAILFNK